MRKWVNLNRSCSLVFCLLVGLLVLLAASSAGAQGVGGAITGTISDPSGAAVAAATVTITNTATGIVTTVTTSTEGFYSVPNLPPGPYTVAANASGFSTTTVTGVTLVVNAEQQINIPLKVGQTSQTVEVSASALAVELSSSSISEVVAGPQVRELPLNGRSWTDLAQLQPGVNAVHTQPAANTSDRASRGWGQVLTISGARGTSNNYLLNGISLNDVENAAPGTFLAGNLGVDAVGEFSVLTSAFPAQYGKSVGGIINAVEKSGTNELHGTVYEFLRNSYMDAKNFFDPPGKIAPFKQNQFGASAGGPIQKDKTFIFGDYEGLRRIVSSTNKAVTLSPTAQQGEFCDAPPSMGAPGCQTYHTVAINPNVAPFLPLWPAPNGKLICPFTAPATCLPNTGDEGFYFFNGRQQTPENFGTLRADRKLTDKNSLWGSLTIDRQTQNSPDSLGDVTTSRAISRTTITLEDTHAFSPTFINVARAGFNRENISSPSGATAVNPIAADTSLGIAAGQTIGRIVAPPLTPFQGGLTLWQASVGIWNSFQESDDVFITKGIHALKTGFYLERSQTNSNGPGGFAGGWSTFADVPSFFEGSPVSLIANSGPGDHSTHFRQWNWAAYVQDDIRLKPTLTVNAGFRYEIAEDMDSTHTGTLANLPCQACDFPIIRHPIDYNPGLAAVVAAVDPNPDYGVLMHVPRNDFGPRVGFAWDPFGNGKTSIRSAFGIYDLILLPYAQSSTDWPSLQSSNSASIPAGTWPKGTFSAGATNINTKRAFWQEQDPKLDYDMQWNLSIQRQFTNTLSVMVGYVGSRSVHNPFHFDDFNVTTPNTSSGVPLWPCGTISTPAGQQFNPTTDCSLFGSYQNALDAMNGYPAFQTTAQCNVLNASNQPVYPAAFNTQCNRINPYIGREPGRIWDSSGIYHGLQVAVFQTVWHGLSYQASYTFSRNLTTSDGTTIGDPYTNSLSSSLYYFNQKLRYGLSDSNITHNFVFSYMYLVPFPSKAPEMLKTIAGGWQVGGIVTIQSGQPMTPLISGDAIGENNTDPISYPNRLTGPGCSSLVNPGNIDNYIKLQCFAPTTPVAYNGSMWLTGGNAGRNIIPGPGLKEWDFSLFKNNYIKRISESFNAQLRLEAFNVLNHPNFSPPTDNEFLFDQTDAPIGGAGAIDLTSTTSRQLQVALKIIF